MKATDLWVNAGKVIVCLVINERAVHFTFKFFSITYNTNNVSTQKFYTTTYDVDNFKKTLFIKLFLISVNIEFQIYFDKLIFNSNFIIK